MRTTVSAITFFTLAIFLAACGGQESAPATPAPSAPQEAHEEEHDEHGHHHEAPHGGVLVEFGDHFGSIEFVLADDGVLTAYVLDAHAESAVPIKQLTLELEVRANGVVQKVVLDAVGNALTGETPGDTSEFVGRVQSMENKDNFEFELKSVEYKGSTFSNLVFSYSPEKE